jgi:hypothetical protein
MLLHGPYAFYLKVEDLGSIWVGRKSARFFLLRWVIGNVAQRFRLSPIDLTDTSVFFAITGFGIYAATVARPIG